MIDKDFGKYLKSGVADKDQATFNAWARGAIPIETCIKRWLNNNQIRDAAVDEKAFIDWLYLLGYCRDNK